MNSKLSYAQDWQQLAHEAKWSAAALAKKCGVSVRTLERYFLRQMGKSPKAWLTTQRQRRAIGLLRDGSRVKEVAGLLSYRPQHFSRDFKKHNGRPPSQLSVLA